MTEINKALIIEALKKVYDPSQQKDIVSLNFVKSINIKDTNVSFILEVPIHRGPAMEPIRKLAEQKVFELSGVTSSTAILTSHEEVSEGSNKISIDEEIKEKVFESKVKHFVAIGSGKGGVGKSTTAVNIAVALKLCGMKVGILDADIYGPSQPRMLGVSGRPNSVGGDIVAPLENYGIKMMSIG